MAPKKLLALLLVGCLFLGSSGENRALERILKSGTITVLTRNNAHCYYTYREQEMGFEYDLAKAFAEFLGVELKVKVSESWDGLLPSLDNGGGDFVAASMTITPSRLKLADFSKGYLPGQQMVITHKNNTGIKSIDDLEGRTIHLRGGTPYEERMRTLKRKGLDITIKVHEDVPTEEFIEGAAEGNIEVTIADSNVALLNRRYYPDIRLAFPIHKPRSLGWAVKKGERALLNKINEFFDTIEQDGTFKEIYNRYYAYVESFDHLDIKKFHERIQIHLPKYEKTIRKAAEVYGFDWRLIVALIYQESQFNPWARSFSGVRGLMQLTVPTAVEMGIKNRLAPQQSIMGGVRYLRRLYDLYEESPEPDRMLIALAAYNVGKGHILDARRIASDIQLDPNKWSSLEKTLPLLRQRKYYKESEFGYCRGMEPVFHVQRILTYYDILKRQAIEYTG
ncbi:MAG: membrane-bound lytic murein transglycosylase MltF [Desulfobacterales bacterium]|nr:membrane-bound lytic murein transglycosylase MltF [Desulfobacterales bacterium]